MLHKKNRYIPALDGLRAFAVTAVILYHLFPAVFIGGYIGVDIFFVISGFLITTLFISEYLQSGRISLKKFWTRRARRLLPALFVTILTISSLLFFVRGDALVGLGQQILGASTFSSNWIEIAMGTNYFAAGASHVFMNFWSLAVEEQFYLLWPLLTIILVTKIKKVWLGILLTGLMAASSAGWMVYLYTHGASSSRVYYGTDTHMFGLMIGAFLAYLSYAATRKKVPRRLLQPFAFARRSFLFTMTSIVAAVGLLIFIFTLSDQSAFTYTGGLLLASVFSACLLIGATGKRGIVQKICELPLLRYIGSRSYGLYLWHWPVIVMTHLLFPSMWVWLFAPITVTTTFVFAELSYQFIETPFRRHGFRSIFKRTLKRSLVTSDGTMKIRHRPHFAFLIALCALLLTVASVIGAPTKTSAQLRIEEGERLVKKQATKIPTKAAPPPHIITDGTKITAVGDSVMLATSPALEAKYPGILINAEVSRSLRRGGLETIEQLKASGQLRDIVIIALGTNGYFGTDNLDKLVAELSGHSIVLVTAHADREWTNSNNQDVATVAKKYKNVAVADWDQAITPHPDLLSPDGIHPLADGDALYVSAVASALSKF